MCCCGALSQSIESEQRLCSLCVYTRSDRFVCCDRIAIPQMSAVWLAAALLLGTALLVAAQEPEQAAVSVPAALSSTGTIYLTIAYCPTDFTSKGAIVSADPATGAWTIVGKFDWPVMNEREGAQAHALTLSVCVADPPSSSLLRCRMRSAVRAV
jgi:hypothetical protein